MDTICILRGALLIVDYDQALSGDIEGEEKATAF
jgi:hypothetical protein